MTTCAYTQFNSTLVFISHNAVPIWDQAGHQLVPLWQRWISSDRPASGMTGLFPWKHICHLCGAWPKCWRGITNEDCRTGGKINHTNDDSKRELRLYFFSYIQFPWNWNLMAASQFSWLTCCRHSFPNYLIGILEAKCSRQERDFQFSWELWRYFIGSWRGEPE